MRPTAPVEDPPGDEVVNHRLGARRVASPELATSSLTGKKISHYRVLEVFGGGGMGVVYRAEDVKLGRAVALKFLPEELGSDPKALERFEREARAASALDHPNLCAIHEFGEHEGQPFIVMQLLEGQTVRDRLASGEGPLLLEELLDIGIQVSDGLQAAHERGIIHRDIKPANIFLTNKGVCKILDFGVAKLLEEAPGFSPANLNEEMVEAPAFRSANRDKEEMGLQPRSELHLTRTGSAMGTAGYMSPEQVRGEKLDARTDIFSFGLVLYEMATGQRAFSGETAAAVHDAIVNKPTVPVCELNSALPGKLVATIDKALEKDRERRYQSATEMRLSLEQVRSGNRAGSRWPLTWIAGWALLAALAVAGALYWRSRNAIKLTGNDTIVLSDFSNSTSDPIFDDALNTALRVELGQTPFLNLLAPDKVRGTLKGLNRAAHERLTSELAREVCLHTNSKAFVASSIADAGNHYGIELTAVDCHTGKILAKTGLEAKSRDQVVKMLGVAGFELRRKLGEPQPSLQKFNRPLEEATTSSLEALQAFSQSGIIKYRKGDAEALPFLLRAVEIDPNFASAYASLGSTYFNLGETRRATENVERAYELSDRASARQRFYIRGLYYAAATGETEKAIQVNTQWIQTYPSDQVPHGILSRLFRLGGQYAMAIGEAKESLRITPEDYPPQHTTLMLAYMALNRLDEAKGGVRRGAVPRCPCGGSQVGTIPTGLLAKRRIRYARATRVGDRQAGSGAVVI